MMIAHKLGSDHTGSHKYTYVILCLNKAIRTLNVSMLSWKSIRHEIRVLKNAAQVSYAVEYIRYWKYFPTLKPEAIVTPLQQVSTIPVDRSTGIEIIHTSDQPLVWYISDFIGWQIDIVSKINKLCKLGEIRQKHQPVSITDLDGIGGIADVDYYGSVLRYPSLRSQIVYLSKMIHIVHCGEGIDNMDITILLNAIKNSSTGLNDVARYPWIEDHNANKYLVITGMPDHLSFLKEADLQREKGWTGDCVIFDISREKTLTNSVYRTLEEASDEPSCNTVWVFTNILPDSTMFSSYRLAFYKIDTNWPVGSISKLSVLE